ncbi:hypothetical protein CY34DRAFT_476743 [Suillus luteus UH-Slu-Lm8-n1]|uniref:Unplaced genomic scaffold CY34scaffold_344, whole genome shotgun sequence n=1 Tax=Suillus luteus UH-Slu-Lm8-n1 TaxID=930992 RepID=A0A0D0AS82_9AGAM|nr:hypothetical protein CY34DRAFT_476743 [Suillus luteus UH-Slu-Lm8-n1]
MSSFSLTIISALAWRTQRDTPNLRWARLGCLKLQQVLALCLEVWVALTHFHELKRPPTDYITRDRFAVSLKMSALYFAVYVRSLSPNIAARQNAISTSCHCSPFL